VEPDAGIGNRRARIRAARLNDKNLGAGLGELAASAWCTVVAESPPERPAALATPKKSRAPSWPLAA